MLHAEAVLLVDYDISEVCELHLILNKGVRTDKYIYLARGYALQGVTSLGSLRGACEDGYSQIHTLGLARYGCKVLTCKNLGRRHHTGLKTIIYGQEHRHQRNHSLSATYIALQQTIHLVSRHGVLSYLFYHTLLRSRKGEWQSLIKEGVEQLAHLRE